MWWWWSFSFIDVDDGVTKPDNVQQFNETRRGKREDGRVRIKT